MLVRDCEIPLAPQRPSRWRPKRSAVETIAQSYKLTASELRVLEAVVEIGGVRPIADALGLSPTTVKTHLRHILQKTGTKRQIDLIKLVAAVASSSEK